MELDFVWLALEQAAREECDRAQAFDYLSSSVRREDWEFVAQTLGKEAVELLKSKARSGSLEESAAILRRMADEAVTGFLEDAKRALREVTSIEKRGELGEKLRKLAKAAELTQRQEGLLEVAIAYHLIDMIPEAAQRASKLTGLAVKEVTSVQAERYLYEASYSYFYGMYTASAVLCRSVLEEVIGVRFRSRVPPAVSQPSGQGDRTLGELYNIVRKPEICKYRVVPQDVWSAVGTVLSIGNAAAHTKPVNESDAWTYLSAARSAISTILTG